MALLLKTKAKVIQNKRGQTIIEAIFASLILLTFVYGLAFFIGIELSKLYLSHLAGDYLICSMQDNLYSACKRDFLNKASVVQPLGQTKIVKTISYSYSSAVEIEFSNRYSKWKLTKNLDLAPTKTAKALSWF